MESLCLAKSTSKYGFMRAWYCSEPSDHITPHVARDEHHRDGDIVWYGPWEDGSYYSVPEDSGLTPWSADD